MNPVLSAIISGMLSGAFFSGAVMLYKARSEIKRNGSETKKTDIDAAAVISETSLALLAPLRQQTEDMQSKITEMSGELDRALAELREYHRRYGPLTAA